MKFIKEEKVFFLKIIAIGLFFVLVSVGIFVQTYRKASLTGFVVNKSVGGVYNQMPIFSKFLLFLQWGLFLGILVYAIIKDKDIVSSKREVSELRSEKKESGSKTDLDTLYYLLTRKLKLKVSTIAKAFEIEKPLALEWGKTMEIGGLASIEYPGIGGPVLVLSDKKKKIDKKYIKEEHKKITQRSERSLLKKLLDKELKKEEKMPATHLDEFYDYLKEKKEVKIADAAKKFNISEDLILEWAKVLEAGDLANIYTSGIGRQSVKINEAEGAGGIEEKPIHKKTPEEVQKETQEHKKNLLTANKLIESENKKKVDAAKELVSELRERNYENSVIRELFRKKGWPSNLIDSLLK